MMGRSITARAALMGAAVVLGSSVLAPSAWADTVSYSIVFSNDALASFPPPFAEVSVNRTDSTHATITFTADHTGTFQYLMGAVNAADVNVNAASFSSSSLSASNSLGDGFSVGTLSSGGSGNVNGFGTFNQTTNMSAGFTSAATTISFTLTDLSGTWASAANVLTPNAGGFVAAAHIFTCPDPCTTAQGPVVVTGFATTPSPIPGAGVPGLVAACVGLLGLARRRRQRIA